MGIFDTAFGGDGESILLGTILDDRIVGGDADEVALALSGDDRVRLGDGNDSAFGGSGQDWLFGDLGADFLRGGRGGDRIFGGAGTDLIDGEEGNDQLHGDSGRETGRGDLGADVLDGGSGDDVLNQSEGNDTLTGGSGSDIFRFKYNDPQVALAAMTGAAFSAITDFDAGEDKLAFDVAGLGGDAVGANFIDKSGPGSRVDSFFSGAAADYMGESAAVITDQSFASGALVPLATSGEQVGDFIIYFNTTVGAGSLLYVTAPDAVRSIARFTDVTSLEELAAKSFTADDFIFV